MILLARFVTVTDAQVGHLTGQQAGLPLGMPFGDASSGAPGAKTNGTPGGAANWRSGDLTAGVWVGARPAGKDGWARLRRRWVSSCGGDL